MCQYFLSSVVLMLYGCYLHEEDHARYELCDCGVCSRKIIYMFWLVKCLGLSESLTLGFSHTP